MNKLASLYLVVAVLVFGTVAAVALADESACCGKVTQSNVDRIPDERISPGKDGVIERGDEWAVCTVCGRSFELNSKNSCEGEWWDGQRGYWRVRRTCFRCPGCGSRSYVKEWDTIKGPRYPDPDIWKKPWNDEPPHVIERLRDKARAQLQPGAEAPLAANNPADKPTDKPTDKPQKEHKDPPVKEPKCIEKNGCIKCEGGNPVGCDKLKA